MTDAASADLVIKISCQHKLCIFQVWRTLAGISVRVFLESFRIVSNRSGRQVVHFFDIGSCVNFRSMGRCAL